MAFLDTLGRLTSNFFSGWNAICPKLAGILCEELTIFVREINLIANPVYAVEILQLRRQSPV